MAYFTTVPYIGSSLSELLYKTEYQRNFVDYIRRAEPKPKSSEVNNKKSMDYSKQRVHEANVFDEKASPPQCSIGVQTDEKKVKFDLTPRNINTVTKSRNVHVEEEKQTSQDEKKRFRESECTYDKGDAAVLRSHTYTNDEIEPRTPSSSMETTTDTTVVDDRRTFSPYYLNLVAGNNSGNYQRAPFIQKKKKVCAPVSNLPNEPALQKKKIIPYFKNHNILRTSTVTEDNSMRMDDNDYSYRRKHVSPDMYKSSYEREFTHTLNPLSPLLTEDRKLAGKKSERNKYDIRSSLTYNAGKYDQSNYQSEYNRQFSPKESKENLATATDDKHFSDYYQQVLDKRKIAYKPFLASYDDYSDRNRVVNKNNEDADRLVERNVEKDSTPQRFRKGRYTRTYRPEMYA